MVRAFRGLIWQKRISYGEFAPNFPPATIVRDALIQQQHASHVVPYPVDKQRREVFKGLMNAWDVIAYEHYQWQPGELAGEQISARWDLSVRHFAAKRRQEPRPEIIRLDLLQVKLLDALAEAADIPHQRGQAEITIPEHLRHEAEEHFQNEIKRRGWQK